MSHLPELNTLISLASLVVVVAMAAWIAPLRKLREEIETLRQANLGEKISDLRDRLRKIEEREDSRLKQLASEYVSLREWNFSQTNAREARAAIFAKLDELNIAVADVAARLDERRDK